MTALRIDTLKRHGTSEILAATVPDPADREARMREMAERWAREFDPNSLVTLRNTMVRFDAERDLAKIRARVLYVLSRTDVLSPPKLASDVMARLHAAGVDATYVEIDSDFGHLASGADSRSGPRHSGAFSTASVGEPEVDGAVRKTGPQAPPSGAHAPCQAAGGRLSSAR